MDVKIKAIGLANGWPPNIIGGFFCTGSDSDWNCLDYWYNAVVDKDEQDEIKATKSLIKILSVRK